jgi:hypothetical protein
VKQVAGAGSHLVGQRNNEIRKAIVSDSVITANTAPWTDTTSYCSAYSTPEACPRFPRRL